MTKVKATMDYLKACQALRRAGRPVHLTTDPAWLLDVAIDRRAGWPEDPHARDIAMPVGGKLPRRATGDAQRHLAQLAQRINTPRLIVRRAELGAWDGYLVRALPERFEVPS